MGTALIFHAGPEFRDSAMHARSHLAARGFSPQVFSVQWTKPSDLPHLGGPVDIAAWYSHGGWDGPIGMFDAIQVSRQLNAESWPLLQTWFRTWVKAGGLFVSHACHSAGSNRYENLMGDQRWVRDVAQDMGVYAVGVEGSTSSANYHHAISLLDYALSGTRAKQAADAYAPGGQKVAPWHGWLRVQGSARRSHQ